MSDTWNVVSADGSKRVLDAYAAREFLDHFAEQRVPEVINELQETEGNRSQEERMAFTVGYAEALSELRLLLTLMAEAPEDEESDAA